MKVRKPPTVSKSEVGKKRPVARKNYHKLLLNGVEFRLNDVAIVKEATDDHSYGRILRIWREPGEELQAFIRLRWFYKPSDVFDEVPEFLSDDELFESDHEQDVFVQTINGKVKVLGLEEYMALDNLTEDVFFTRAKFCAATRTLEPRVETWERICTCKTILSPSSEYVRCRECGKRFHPACVKLAAAVPDWVCSVCR